MSQTKSFDLVIRHKSDGTTLLKTGDSWATYDDKGVKMRFGNDDNAENPTPLPEMIAVFGSSKSKLSASDIKDILRTKPEAIVRETVGVGADDLDAQHTALFEKLKSCLHENAPANGAYSLNLQYHADPDEIPELETELIEPNDVELAALLAFLNFMNNKF